MGAWGHYDDQNDPVQDEFCRFMALLGIDSMNREVLALRIREDDGYIYNTLVEFSEGINDRNIAGLVLSVMKSAYNQNSDHSVIPSTIPKNFPPSLIERSLRCSKNSLNLIKDEGWRKPEDRKEALEHQIYLFSNGKEGRISGQLTKSTK